MSMTFEAHRRRVRMLAGNRIDDVRAGECVNIVLEELYRWPWSFRKKEGLFVTIAPVSTGTVSPHADPTKVQGIGTGWTAALVGRYFRVSTDQGFYRITAVDVGGQVVTLETAYAGTILAGTTYVIFQHLYSLNADVDVAASLSSWRKLRENTLEQVDRLDARHIVSSTFAWEFVYRGEDAAGAVQVEVRPVPGSAFPIRYHYVSKPPILVQGTDDAVRLPIDEEVVNYKAASLALYTYLAEHPEIPGADRLQSLADRHDLKGQAAFQEAQFHDFQKVGASNAVRDDDWNFVDDEIAWSHDIGLY